MTPGVELSMLTIATAIDHEQVIRKSRFMTHLEPVKTIEQADAAIASVRKQHHAARHHCTALIIGTTLQRSSDDGEPAGTAGVPMLEVLRRRELTDVVAIVTRYFGGVLLGTGGLARAYSSSVTQALDKATLLRRAEMAQVVVDAPLADAGRLEHVLRTWAGFNFEGVEYGDSARFHLLVAPDKLSDLRDELASVGAPPPVVGDSRVVEFADG